MSIKTLSDRSINQWGGLAFAIGNLLFFLNKVDEMSRLFFQRRMDDIISGEDAGVIIFGQIALMLGYVAFVRTYLSRVSDTGKISLYLLGVGGFLLAIGHGVFITALDAEFLFLFVLLGTFLLLAGLIWFGVLNLQKQILGSLKWLPLATGIMGFIGFVLFGGEEITATFLLFRTLFSVGLIGLGLIVWRENSGSAEMA